MQTHVVLCPSYFICPSLRFDRLIREKLEGVDVNVLSHQTCSTGRAFPAPWIQEYAIFESFLMIRLFRWAHVVSLLLNLCPPKSTCRLVVFLRATMSPGYPESSTDRLVNCKAGWASPDSIKKHMFFKKVHGLSELRFKNSTIFLYVKTEKKTVFMFALQCFIFTHWVYTVGYATYIFWCFFFVGLEYVMTTNPQYPTSFQWAICGSARSAFSPYTIQENRHWESLELNFFGGEAVTEDLQHWMGWLEDFP